MGSADDFRRATVNFRLANFLAWGTGDLDEAETACHEAVRLFEAAGRRRQAAGPSGSGLDHEDLRGDMAGIAEEIGAGVVEAAEALGDRFVVMQGLAALGYGMTLRARYRPPTPRSAARWRSPGKTTRPTASRPPCACWRPSALCKAGAASGVSCSEQARSLNSEFRDTILVELEAFVRWMAGDFAAAAAAARGVRSLDAGQHQAAGARPDLRRSGGCRGGRYLGGGIPDRPGPAGVRRPRLVVVSPLRAARPKRP